MMKKIVSIVAVLMLLAVSLTMAGCGTKRRDPFHRQGRRGGGRLRLLSGEWRSEVFSGYESWIEDALLLPGGLAGIYRRNLYH